MSNIIPFGPEQDANLAHVAGLTDGQIEGHQALAHSQFGKRRDAMDKFRTQLWGRDLEPIVELANAKARVDSWRGSNREDSDFAGSNGVFLARQLEYTMKTVFEEKRPQLNGLDLFPADTEVPIGATSYRIIRRRISGEARIHGLSGSDIPVANVSNADEVRPIKYLVTGAQINLGEMLSSDFANLDVWASRLRAARRVHDELMNYLIWNGNAGANLYGILTYPWLARILSSVAFDGTATGANMVAQLSRFARFPSVKSKQAFQGPTDMAVTPRVYAVLAETRMDTGTDTTVLEFFLRNNGFIKRVHQAQELEAVNGSAYDGILMWNANPGSGAITNVVPQGLTALPVQLKGFDQLVPMYSAFGGIKMPNVGHNVLGLVTPPSY